MIDGYSEATAFTSNASSQWQQQARTEALASYFPRSLRDSTAAHQRRGQVPHSTEAEWVEGRGIPLDAQGHLRKRRGPHRSS